MSGGTDNLASTVDDIDRVVVTRLQTGTHVLDANGAGDQDLVVVELVGNAGQSVLIIRQNKGDSGFRPDDDVGSFTAICRRLDREREMLVEDGGAIGIRVHLGFLIDRRLDDAHNGEPSCRRTVAPAG